jgi:membrane associated rhomboid family serine protease
MWFLFYFYGDIAFGAIALIWGGSGVITWFIGRPSYHIGASGLIYGFLFFLFFSGIFRRIRELMALSVLLVFLYGSIIWEMLPIAEYIQPDTSWEGHLSGAIAGFLVAIYYRNKPPQKPEILDSENDEEADAGFPVEPEDISDNQMINR